MLKVGIVGLPNVGKSTLFSALTKKQVDCSNFPFCTIEPNVGVVEVPDERIDKLAEISKSAKVIPTAIEFVDIAGLVKGAHKGEGLGNKFLATIREVDMILHVVRDFEDADVHHVDGSIDPIRDSEIIEMELMMADLAQVENRLKSMGRKAESSKDKAVLNLASGLNKYKDALEAGKLAITVELTDDEKEAVSEVQLMTAKKILYVINVSEEDASERTSEFPDAKNSDWKSPFSDDRLAIPISVKIEAEIAAFDEEEAKMFLDDLGFQESGLDKVIKKCYQLLNLITFFTAGEQETRAWTIEKGSTAPQAAGKIHTDFEKGFIRAETIGYQDFIDNNGESGARDVGKLRVEGKEYIVKDGDVMHFRFSV